MKRIRILAVLVVLVFLFAELGDAMRGFMDGWNEAGDSTSFANYSVSLSLKADDGVKPDSVFCPQLNTYAPYLNEAVCVNPEKAGIESSGWHIVLSILTIPLALFAIYGFYCLFRMVFWVTRGEVFTRKNVFMMRCFVYSLILAGACMEVSAWLHYAEVASQVQFVGYEVLPYTLKIGWTANIVLALLTEIFAIGVKLKEEQDLTI